MTEEFNPEVMARAVAQNRKNIGLPPQKDAIAGRVTLMFSDCRDHDRHAFEAYLAVWRNDGNHVVIAAPTLDALAEAWDQIVDGIPLDRDAAQHVFIISAKGPNRPTMSK